MAPPSLTKNNRLANQALAALSGHIKPRARQKNASQGLRGVADEGKRQSLQNPVRLSAGQFLDRDSNDEANGASGSSALDFQGVLNPKVYRSTKQRSILPCRRIQRDVPSQMPSMTSTGVKTKLCVHMLLCSCPICLCPEVR